MMRIDRFAENISSNKSSWIGGSFRRENVDGNLVVEGRLPASLMSLLLIAVLALIGFLAFLAFTAKSSVTSLSSDPHSSNAILTR